MTRFTLSQEDEQGITARLPDIEWVHDAKVELYPNRIAFLTGATSRLQVAAVCYSQTIDVVCDVQYSLAECLAHHIWYERRHDPPDPCTAAWITRFYAEDAVMRLYVAGECLADGIVNTLPIDRRTLRGKHTSLAIDVGQCLSRTQPSHPITSALQCLVGTRAWSDAMEHRRRIVHDEPLRLSDQGLLFAREPRWKRIPDDARRAYVLDYERGDPPESDVDTVVENTLSAHESFLACLSAVLAKFWKEVERVSTGMP